MRTEELYRRGSNRSTQAEGDRADRPAAPERAVELAGNLRRRDGGGISNRHAWGDAGGDRAVRYLHAGGAEADRIHRSVRATLARRASAVVHRRQDDPLFQWRGGFHAAEFEGRPVLYGVRCERSDE